MVGLSKGLGGVSSGRETNKIFIIQHTRLEMEQTKREVLIKF